MSPEIPRNAWRDVRIQLPFLLWLVVLWMLLWNQFTVLSLVTGIVVAIFVTRVFRLPTVELSGRINVWWSAVFLTQFLAAVVHGALLVAWQVIDFRRQPGTAIIEVKLRYPDDLVMTHVSVTASLIPGSFVVETDRLRGILYLHFIGARSMDEVEKQRQDVLRWERRIVRAVGSREQYAALRADEGRPLAHTRARTNASGGQAS
ncbi:Na+/H+ antiporter subunit E [Microbacterium sp. YY-01]|uniref:Na+/H+ antiporter subunit E n=1 Tax=Microbacterium sp. YY-01 TaxID=3421634 RepID=UPI003D18264C